MPIKHYKPTTNGRRNMSALTYEEITTSTPEKSLLVTLNKKAGRNIPNVLVLTVSHASVYDLLNHDVVVLTKAAAAKYEEVLA